MNGMRLIKDEFIKLKRCNILWVGIITLLCSPLLSVLQQESLNAPISDYGYANLVNGVIWNNMGFFLPVTLMLLGGYMINREYTDDTLKEIFTIPISYKKLMLGKIGALLILSILYRCYSFLLATGISALFYPGGLNGMAVIKALIQICGMGLCICISILPFVCWCGAAKNRFWVGTVLVFVYGFLGIPLAGHGFQDYYPISAGLSIIQYSGDTGSTTANFRPEIAGVVLILTLVLSWLILIVVDKRKRTNTL